MALPLLLLHLSAPRHRRYSSISIYDGFSSLLGLNFCHRQYSHSGSVDDHVVNHSNLNTYLHLQHDSPLSITNNYCRRCWCHSHGWEGSFYQLRVSYTSQAQGQRSCLNWLQSSIQCGNQLSTLHCHQYYTHPKFNSHKSTSLQSSLYTLMYTNHTYFTLLEHVYIHCSWKGSRPHHSIGGWHSLSTISVISMNGMENFPSQHSTPPSHGLWAFTMAHYSAASTIAYSLLSYQW